MFKRGGFASYTKTGRRMQYGAAVGSLMAKGGSKSNDSTNSSEESRSAYGYVLFFIFVYLLLNGIIELCKNKQIQPQ